MSAASPSRVTVSAASGDGYWWELANAAPSPHLTPYVFRLCGYQEWSAASVTRLQPAFSGVPLIIGFAGPIGVFADHYAHETITAFAAGLDARAAHTVGSGHQAGMQVDLTPPGAARLLGMPLSEIAGQVVSFENLFGRAGRRLQDQLMAANDWDTRLALTEAFLETRLAATKSPPPLIAAIWHALTRTKGQIAIADLAADQGVSRKHLTQQFRLWTGMPPSIYGRILRFERALDEVRRQPQQVDWAQIAAGCGYFDQPHFNRDFREFAGVTPSAYLASLQPTGPVVLSGI